VVAIYDGDTMGAVESGGVEIRYEVVGAGPTVLLHHGGGFTRESWERAGWVELLVSDYRVVTFDARGNGESEKPTEPTDYDLHLMVNDVLTVADACEAEVFHYLGFSLGGKVGWGVAARAQHRLASMGLIGAEPRASEATSGSMIELFERGMDAVAAAMAQMWEMPDWALDQQRRNDPDALVAYFQSQWPDLSHVPGALETPSLLMCGTDDEVYDAMVSAADDGDLMFAPIEGADHMASFLSVQTRSSYRDFLRQVAWNLGSPGCRTRPHHPGVRHRVSRWRRLC
jgi:pimeloyl-ACP methyl ester carboxylesterase